MPKILMLPCCICDNGIENYEETIRGKIFELYKNINGDNCIRYKCSQNIHLNNGEYIRGWFINKNQFKLLTDEQYKILKDLGFEDGDC